MSLDIDQFSRRLFSALNVDPPIPFDKVNRSTGLFDELGLDSLQAFQLFVFCESLADLLVPLLDMPLILTVGDAHDYYLLCCTSADE